ncbi:DUF2306 domain-containing protein [Streptosporangiaceae bacterium NEAU-GS5]|nr:DUF2306 domain-containing protein [Streptosporangiaceae bacterium NEAU-GS5]
MTSQTITKPRGGWRATIGLLALTLIPMAGGGMRMSQLVGGAAITPENARFFAQPFPVVVHIVTVSVFSVLGAFQFARPLRRRRPAWHRRAGRVVVFSGILAVTSGLWMAVYYPHPVGDGPLVEVFRLIFGTVMLVSLLLGLAAIRRGEVATHRAWMTRGYAVALGAGTQAFTLLPMAFISGPPDEVLRGLLMGAGWVLNLAVAEWVIRRRPLSV